MAYTGQASTRAGQGVKSRGRGDEESGLKPEGSFKAAEARYTAVDQVDIQKLQHWLAKARDIQWDYKNIVRRKGRLDRLK